MFKVGWLPFVVLKGRWMDIDSTPLPVCLSQTLDSNISTWLGGVHQQDEQFGGGGRCGSQFSKSRRVWFICSSTALRLLYIQVTHRWWDGESFRFRSIYLVLLARRALVEMALKNSLHHWWSRPEKTEWSLIYCEFCDVGHLHFVNHANYLSN